MHRTTRDITNAEFANRARSRWWEIQMLKFAIIFQYKFDKKKKKKKKLDPYHAKTEQSIFSL